jgi:beta-galactosidase
LEIFLNGKHHASLQPDTKNYPNLKHAPCFTDLDLDGAGRPELRIDGYVGKKLAASRSFSADPTQDQFSFEADDQELISDGIDATRLVFKVVDKFGANRAFAGGNVSFEVAGPGAILGDNPFGLGESGGVGAIWVKTIPNQSGRITVKASHPLGSKSVTIHVIPSLP